MLHLHRAERADVLVAALAAVVAEPLDDPMQAEVVSVPTRGVERWVSQRLSADLGATSGRDDGICANVDFPFPGTVVGGAVATVSGVDRDADPWQPERSVWPLLEAVDSCLGEAWLGDLTAHLAGADTRRFTSVRHIADLYDRYGVHRPQMVRSWAAGDDVDGAGRPLSRRVRWQPELWRRLSGRLAVASPAERLPDACERLRTESSTVNLPRRLSLFGLTRLPASYLQVLRALAAERDVHLFLLHPSPALWSGIAGEITGRVGIMRRAADRTMEHARHPLLRSWGRDAREMQLVLTGGDGGAHVDHHADHHVDHRDVASGDTLLGLLQQGVRDDRPLPGPGDPRPLLDPADRSVGIHACHGRARQVEVVRDVILHLLADDDSLEARDVIVMCPDIETYAPLIHATFGAGPPADETAPADETVGPGEHRPPDLRVRLADRSIRQTNPVLGVVSELLSLADARLTASQVLDLAGRDPVRRRFGFDDDDLARLAEWVADTGVRWGLDGGHRAAYGLGGLEANTWRAGLDRTLLGVAMAEEDQRLFGGVLPLDDVESGAVDLAGRFAELLDRLQAALDGLTGRRTVARWAEAIGAAADALTATGERDSWQAAQLRRLLDDLSAEAGGGSAILALTEIRSLLADRLRGRPTRANFRTGHLTVCTLVPMRSVPHRVVVLLGLDDGVFPRPTARDGDDLMLDDPYVGDRDSRSEDRQLLLDALMAATDRLVITYAGRDERTNAERPPAVPVGELLDLIDRTVRTTDGTPARAGLVLRHPLQPFDARNFTVGALQAGRPWSFDEVALAGARAATGARAEHPPFLVGALPPPAGAGVVELDQLVAFVGHPVRAFLRRRLGVSLGDFSQEVDDALPVSLDALQTWAVGERLLAARLAGAASAACRDAEVARGVLPPGEFGMRVLREVGPQVETLVQAADGLVEEPVGPGSVDVRLRLPDGRSLVGTVPVLGRLCREVTYSRVGPKHRLAAWVRFLCLTATDSDAGYVAATVGRSRGASRSATVTVARLAQAPGAGGDGVGDLARVELARLVDLYDRGMREPLPLYAKTSAAYAEGAGGLAKKARDAWESARFPKEDREPEHVLVLGAGCSFDDLLRAAPGPDESGPGWPAAEDTRFGRYARRLWDPLLAAEELVDR